MGSLVVIESFVWDALSVEDGRSGLSITLPSLGSRSDGAMISGINSSGAISPRWPWDTVKQKILHKFNISSIRYF